MSTSGTFLQKLLTRYAGLRRRILLTHGLALTALAALVPLPVVCLLDRFSIFSDRLRITAWALYLAGVVAVVVWRVAWVLRRRHTDLETAFLVGDHVPQSHDVMAAAVDLAGGRSASDPGVSRDLIEHVRREADARAAEVDPLTLLSRRRARRLVYCAAFAMAVQIGLLWVPGLGYAGLLRRFFLPFGNFDRESGVAVAVTPGSADVGDGETVVIEAELSDPRVARLGLYRGSAGEEPQRFEMNRLENGKFRFTLPNMRRDITYFLADGLIQTRRYTLNVMRRPLLEGLALKYTFPSYTGLSATEERKSRGDFRVPAGTRVAIQTTWDADISWASLRRILPDGRTQDDVMAVDGRSGRIDLEMKESFEYQVVARSRKLNLENANRMTFTAEAVVDRGPRVVVTEPSGTLRLEETALCRLRFEAQDEYAVTAARLRVERAGAQAVLRQVAAEGLGQKAARGECSLSLSELRVEPGEELKLIAEAQDNQGQWGQSAPVVVQVPVAAGRPESLRLAEAVVPLRQAVAAMAESHGRSSAAFGGIVERLRRRPVKWNAGLEQNWHPLRPSFESLRQQTARASGAAADLVRALAGTSEQDDFEPLATLLVEMDAALQRVDVETATALIRDDFKGRGRDQAEAIQKILADSAAVVTSLAAYLPAYERSRRLDDLTARTEQLLTAQQGVLIEGCTETAAAARLNQRLRSILAEFNKVLDAAAPTGAVSSAVAAALRKDVATLGEAIRDGGEFPRNRLTEFAPAFPKLAGALESAGQKQRSESQRQAASLSAQWSSRNSLAEQMKTLSGVLREIREELAEEPIDKADEMEILPPLVDELRQTVDHADRICGELWRRSEAQAGASGNAVVRASLARLACAFERRKANTMEAVRVLCRQITATFPGSDQTATPRLKDLRTAIEALESDLRALAEQAAVIECDVSLAALERRAARILDRQYQNPDADSLADAAAGLAGAAGRLASQMMATGDQKEAATLNRIASSVGDARSDRLAAIASAWSDLQTLAATGTVRGRATRDMLAVSWKDIGDALQASARDARAAGERAGAMTKPESVFDPGAVRGLLMELRRVDNGVMTVLGLLAAEAPLVQGVDEAALRRFGFLRLWQIRSQTLAPAILAVEKAEAAEDGAELLRLAARFAQAGGEQLKEAAGWAAEGAGRGLTGVPGELETEFAQWKKGSAAAAALAAETGRKDADIGALIRKGQDLRPATDPAMAEALLESASQEFSVLAGREEQLAAMLPGAGALVQSVNEAYAKAAAECLPATVKLLDALKAAQEPAARMGPQIMAEVKSAQAMAQAARPLAEAFARSKSPKDGAAFSKALEPQAGSDLTAIPDLMGAAVERFKTREKEQQTAVALLQKAAPAIARLNEAAARYNEEDAKKIAAYDAMKAAADKAFKLIEPDLDDGFLVHYFAPKQKEAWWFWRPYDKYPPRFWYEQAEGWWLKNTDAQAIYAGAAKAVLDGRLPTDAFSYRVAMLRAFWASRFYGKVGIHVIGKTITVNLREGRHFVFGGRGRLISKPGQPVVSVTFAEHWDDVANDTWGGADLGNAGSGEGDPTGLGGISYWLAHIDEVANLPAKDGKTEDVEKFKKFKTHLGEAREILSAASKAAMPFSLGYTDQRRAWAKQAAEFRKEFSPLAEEAGRLAAVYGWKAPEMIPAKRARDMDVGARSTVPELATALARLVNELAGVEMYDLLGGEGDPNANTAKAKEELLQKPPAGVFEGANVLAGLSARMIRDIANYLGESSAAGEESIAAKLDAALWLQAMKSAEGRVFGEQFKTWRATLQRLREIQARYDAAAGADFGGTAETYVQARRQFAGELRPLAGELAEIARLIGLRAATSRDREGAGAAKLPLANQMSTSSAPFPDDRGSLATDQAKRRIRIPEKGGSWSDLALVAAGLAAEVKGVADYDLLCGEGDKDIDAEIARAEQKKRPPAKPLEFTAALAAAAQRFMNEMEPRLAAPEKDGPLARIEADCRLIVAAGNLLADLRMAELPLRTALENSQVHAQRLDAAVAACSATAIGRLARSAGWIKMAIENLPAGQSIPGVAELKSAPDPEITRRIEAATAALKAEQRAEAAQAAKILRGHVGSIRTTLDALKTTGGQRNAAPASVTLIQDGIRRLYQAAVAAEADRTWMLAAAARSFRRAAEVRADEVGRQWALSAGISQVEEVAKVPLRRAAGSGAAVAATGSTPQRPAALVARPAVSEARGSDYGRLPAPLLRELENASAERMPPEAVAAWNRYAAMLRHPVPLSEPARKGEKPD